jgi:hypothetical protein
MSTAPAPRRLCGSDAAAPHTTIGVGVEAMTRSIVSRPPATSVGVEQDGMRPEPG